MADQILPSRTEITSVADDDLLHVVDVSDTTTNPTGTSKKIQASNLIPTASKGVVKNSNVFELGNGSDVAFIWDALNSGAKLTFGEFRVLLEKLSVTSGNGASVDLQETFLKFIQGNHELHLDKTNGLVINISGKTPVIGDSLVVESINGTEARMGFDTPVRNIVSSTSTPLQINTKEFVMHINGADVTFPSETLALPASTTQYIGFDLVDYSIHFLRRNYQDGMIWVAKVTTDGSGVIDIEQINPVLPLDKCYNFYDKLNKTLKPVKVAIIGDSLGEGTVGGYDRWYYQLFDVTYIAYGNNVPNVARVSYDNYSSGGQTSHYGALWTGQASKSGDGDFNNTAISYDNQAQNEYFTFADYDVLKDTPIFETDYDLVIVLFGVNGGTHKFAYLENMIKNLRDKDIETIVCTENFRSTNLEQYYDEGDNIKSITDRTGASLADTWSLMRESEYKGVPVLHDAVHSNQAGHNVYGVSFRTILNNIRQDIGNNRVAPARTLKYQDESFLSQTFPNYCEMDCLPHNHTGELGNSNMNVINNPQMRFNSATQALSTIQLLPGEFAEFNNAYASAFDIIIDGRTEAVFSWYKQNGGSFVGTFDHGTNTGNRPEVVEGSSVASYTTIPSNIIGNGGIRVTCDSGTLLRLVGINWHVYKNRLIPFKDIDVTGSWSEESWSYSHPRSIYTDTINDTFSFNFEGSGCTLFLSNKSAAGIVDIYLNGEIYLADEDLYTTSVFAKSIYISNVTSDFYDVAPIKNTVTVHLKGVNASAITPIPANRRLQVLMIKEYDRR